MVKQDLILSMSEPTNRTIYAKKGDSGRLYDIFIADAEKENGTLRILQPDGSEVTAPAIIQAGGDAYKGDLVTFDALEEVPLTKAEVTLESTQDGTPWIGSESNEVPYNFRAVSDSGLTIGNVEYDEIHGGTIAWNQLYEDRSAASAATEKGITRTYGAENIVTFSGTSSGYAIFYVNSSAWPRTFLGGHKYAFFIIPSGTPNNGVRLIWTPTSAWAYNGGFIVNVTSATSTNGVLRLRVEENTAITGNYSVRVLIFDLTQMFGSTIADYVYGLEQATTGAGVAWFKSLFPKPYYAYDSGTLLSVTGLSKHKTVGFNLFDKSAIEAGKWFNDNNGTITNATGYNLSDYIRVTPNSTIYHSASGSLRGLGFDASKNVVNAGTWTFNFTNSGTYTVPSNVHYIRFVLTDANVSSMIVNLSSSKNGTYEPYTAHEYILDSDVVLRGIPKLDANNKLYYDGDVYGASGSVTRKYGIVDLGTLTWNKQSTHMFWCAPPNRPSATWYGICSKYVNRIVDASISSLESGQWTSNGGSKEMYVRDDAYSDKDTFKTSLSGVYLVYELATPTTETADAFTSPQSVSADGTEEYVIAEQSGVAMPVGHKSHYGQVYPIVASNETQVWNEDWEVGGISSSGADNNNVTNAIRSKGYTSVLPNTTYYISTPLTSSNSVAVYFYDNSQQFISPRTLIAGSGTFTTLQSAKYMRFNLSETYGTTYNNDIMVNIGSNSLPYISYEAIKVSHSGKNLLDNSNGIEVITNNLRVARFRGSGYGNPILLKGGHTYTISSNSNTQPYPVIYVNYPFSSETIMRSSSTTRYFTYTPTEDVYVGLNFYWSGGRPSDATNVQVELNESMTAYEPYQGSTHSISLGRKVYGGKVDLTSGKLTVTHAIVDMGDLGWVTGGTNMTGIKRMVSNATEVVNYIKKPTSASEVADITCSAYQSLNSNQVYVRMTGVSINTGGSVSLYDENFNTEDSVADFTVSVTGQKLVFALATPIEYDLTPTQISTLLGTNNIWSSGTVEVAFEYDGLFAQLPEEATEQVGKCIGDVAFTGASSMPFILHILDDVQEETP